MNEERKMILNMLQEGTITAEEAERLLDAIPEDNAAGTDIIAAGTSTYNSQTPRRIRVLVTENGQSKANVKVPFSLVRAGLKIGKAATAVGAKHAKDDDEVALLNAISNIDVDELIASLDDGEITLPYTIVDVDEDNSHVTVILE